MRKLEKHFVSIQPSPVIAYRYVVVGGMAARRNPDDGKWHSMGGTGGHGVVFDSSLLRQGRWQFAGDSALELLEWLTQKDHHSHRHPPITEEVCHAL